MTQRFQPISVFTKDPYKKILAFPKPKDSEIKKRLTELKKLLDENQEILFTDLIKGKELLDQARSFILLLFVANEGNIDLDQEYDDIRIRVV